VPHKPGTLIISHMAYARHLLWLERKDGLPQIMIRDRRPAKNTRSPLPRRPIRSACRVLPNTTATSSASPIRR
jgi:protease II